MFKPAITTEVEEMLKFLMKKIDDLDPWDLDLLIGVQQRLKEGTSLTRGQRDALDRIWNKYIAKG